MQVSEVVNDIPVPATRGFRTAPRVNDAAEADVRHALVLANRAAARQPARPGSRRCGAEIPADDELGVRSGVSLHLNILFKRAEGGPGRQSGLGHGGGVSAKGWHV